LKIPVVVEEVEAFFSGVGISFPKLMTFKALAVGLSKPHRGPKHVAALWLIVCSGCTCAA